MVDICAMLTPGVPIFFVYNGTMTKMMIRDAVKLSQEVATSFAICNFDTIPTLKLGYLLIPDALVLKL